MDVGGIRDRMRRPSGRSARLFIAAGLLLAVPLIWSVRQSRLTREALDRAVAAERAASQARTDVEQARAQLRGQDSPPRDPAIRRSRHDGPREIERVRELYQEIEGLTELRDQVEQSLQNDRLYVPKKGASPR
jgi:hypothetical protein